MGGGPFYFFFFSKGKIIEATRRVVPQISESKGASSKSSMSPAVSPKRGNFPPSIDLSAANAAKEAELQRQRERMEEEQLKKEEYKLQDHFSDSLIDALHKLRVGSQQNVHGRSLHADLRGFEGKPMSKEVFIREVRGQLGVHLTKKEAEILFWYFDSDHGGTVSFVEMLTKIQHPKKFMSLDKSRALDLAKEYLSGRSMAGDGGGGGGGGELVAKARAERRRMMRNGVAGGAHQKEAVTQKRVPQQTLTQRDFVQQRSSSSIDRASLSGEAVVERALAVQDMARAFRESREER